MAKIYLYTLNTTLTQLEEKKIYPKKKSWKDKMVS